MDFARLLKRLPPLFTCMELAVAALLWLRGHTCVQHNIKIAGIQIDVLSHQRGRIFLTEVKWIRHWQGRIPVGLPQQQRLQQAAAHLAAITGQPITIQVAVCSTKWPFIKLFSLVNDT